LNDTHIRFFFLGAAEGVTDFLRQKYVLGGIQVVGSFAGSPDEMFDDQIVEMINAASPDVLFVAYGAPFQEFWIARNLHKIPCVKVAMGVGGAFDFLSGKLDRAPVFMRKIGLEWLYRLLKEPRKRLRRIVNATVVFPYRVMVVRERGEK